MTDVQSLVGQSLGQYELTELIGRGGMGAVYQGYQASLKRHVAVKVLPFTLSLQAGYVQRFTREAETAASLEHSHIVPIYDYGTQDGVGYVIMRLLSGGSLADRLREARKLRKPLPSITEVSQLLTQVSGALDYAHRRNVIHRDIKLGNIMFDNQGDAFVVDFGIAKLTDHTTQLTSPGALLGTPLYMAPELWRGEQTTPAVDQYAMAVVIYALLTGQMPFEGKTTFDLMHQHMEMIPDSPNTLRAKIPVAVGPVLGRALAKVPDERFSTMTEFAKTFELAINRIPNKATGFFTIPLSEKMVLEATPSADPPSSTATPTPSKSAPVQQMPKSTLRPELDTVILSTISPTQPPQKILIIVGIVLLIIALLLGVILFIVSRSKAPQATVLAPINALIRVESFQ